MTDKRVPTAWLVEGPELEYVTLSDPTGAEDVTITPLYTAPEAVDPRPDTWDEAAAAARLGHTPVRDSLSVDEATKVSLLREALQNLLEVQYDGCPRCQAACDLCAAARRALGYT